MTFVVNKKKLQKNTYKVIDFKIAGGGTGVQFFEPFEDYTECIDELETINVRDLTPKNINKIKSEDLLKYRYYYDVHYHQFTKDEIEEGDVWRVKDKNYWAKSYESKDNTLVLIKNCFK